MTSAPTLGLPLPGGAVRVSRVVPLGGGGVLPEVSGKCPGHLGRRCVRGPDVGAEARADSIARQRSSWRPSRLSSATRPPPPHRGATKKVREAIPCEKTTDVQFSLTGTPNNTPAR
ncbi:hypothetical protein GCM10010286_15980 [Streptomyces toxytricini]|nr:hypothetical protein GCM10010286_15980 [Streptomyces toxytricini]